MTGAAALGAVVDEAALSTYLRHHLAGSEAAISLASGLAQRSGDRATVVFLDRFLGDLERDQSFLEMAVRQLGGDQGVVQRGLAFASGVVEKLRDVIPGSTPTELEDLEALAVGVWGKRLLWGALGAIADADDRFASLPVAELSRRAEEQERALVGLRQDAVARSFLPSGARSGERESRRDLRGISSERD